MGKKKNSLESCLFQWAYQNRKAGTRAAEILKSIEETEKILKIGIQYPIYSTYEIEGMLYKIGVIGKWCWNEEDILVLKVTICFVETSHTRIVYLYFEDKKVTMKLKEEPNLLVLIEEVPVLFGGESKDMMMKLATSLKDMDYSKYLLKKVIEPVIEGEQQK